MRHNCRRDNRYLSLSRSSVILLVASEWIAPWMVDSYGSGTVIADLIIALSSRSLVRWQDLFRSLTYAYSEHESHRRCIVKVEGLLWLKLPHSHIPAIVFQASLNGKKKPVSGFQHWWHRRTIQSDGVFI
ncbi:hypothetical protein AVEN_99191-1 [Araneus ventricosus]|uniref:Uncharacterized protein n=1 Tax=Araneus ventricosus TaxID=182803 RepID=A0A4Y2CJ91_ARAVE|nr:hypothetical protein AVEN_99191-1 [Araneus ventricosus]